jgi:hypothetical protein
MRMRLCYICLDEDDDDDGKPLVRDCSCRGDSAGFAHQSCIVQFAEQKSKEATAKDDPSSFNAVTFAEYWRTCPNCKQRYQKKLSVDLTSAFVSFAERTYGHDGNSDMDKWRVMKSLQFKITASASFLREQGLFPCREESATLSKDDVIDDCESAIKRLLGMVDEMKNDKKMNGWVHKSKTSLEYQYYKVLCGDYESHGYIYRGFLHAMDRSEEGVKNTIKNYEKARVILSMLGLDVRAAGIERNLVVARAQLASFGKNPYDIMRENSAVLLENAKMKYEHSIGKFGATSVSAIESGLACLVHMEDVFEAERLAMKLAANSHQAHGPDHSCTKLAVELLDFRKRRYVEVPPSVRLFLALRYEDDGEICVVKGPIAEPRREDDEQVFRIDRKNILPRETCIVICHGLVRASYLNGEVGVVKECRKIGTEMRYLVHFENKRHKHALVKMENLRIAFDLPDKK